LNVAEVRIEIRVAIGDHVDALRGRDRLDSVRPLDRLDQHASNDVGIDPWRILGRVPAAYASHGLMGVRPQPAKPSVSRVTTAARAAKAVATAARAAKAVAAINASNVWIGAPA
jgi:hypothetical protein